MKKAAVITLLAIFTIVLMNFPAFACPCSKGKAAGTAGSGVAKRIYAGKRTVVRSNSTTVKSSSAESSESAAAESK